jgi:tetratricopeptide (TPR) repeat protein
LKIRSGSVWVAVSLFALHPTNVESIFWASERKNLLAALFFLLSFLFYIHYRKSQSRSYYLLSVFFYLTSLLSKVSAVPAVAILLCYDYFIGKDKFRELKLYDKIPYLVFAEIATFWTIHAAQLSHSLATYHKQGMAVSLLAIPMILVEYLGLLLFPHHLNIIYLEHAQYSWSSIVLWLSFLIVLVVVFLIWKYHQSHFFWLVFSLVLLLPVLNLIPLPVKMANRYLYLPQIGFWVFLGTWVFKVSQSMQHCQLLRKAFLVGLCCWSLYLIDRTLGTMAVWKNSYTLWTDSLKQDFNNPLAHINMGDYFLKRVNLPNRAAVHNLLALSFYPRSYLACYNLGVYFMQNKNWERSRNYLNRAITFNPENDDATNALGAVYFLEGKLTHALSMFYNSVWINPKNQDAWSNVFHIYAKMGRWKEAKEAARQMILLFPDWPMGRQCLSECP